MPVRHVTLGQHNQTVAVNRLTLLVNGGFAAGTEFALYGLA